ncbi:MAG: ABC transporter ATP-binding protein [Lachnospiraceae bacterium]
MKSNYAVEMKGITKRFGRVVANFNINMTVEKGEIRALLGENGSGKTTLMNMLSGIYYPDEGQIYIDGEPAGIGSPSDAFRYGVGMIHQHFKLVEVFNAAENMVLGNTKKKVLDMKRVMAELTEIVEKYGFEIDLKKKTYDMSVSEKQTVEIIKTLYRGSNILILDEPTAVLTPQETDKLFQVLRKMKADGKTIIIITHKLHEVLAISDKVTILRKGEYIDTVLTKETDEMKLTEMMVGKKVELNIDRPEPQNVSRRISLTSVSCKDEYGVSVLKDVSFDINAGEILGIAGIAGSGQKELLEAIAGLQKIQEGGEICYYDEEGSAIPIQGKNPMELTQMGISLSFVPEDRLGMGLVGSMGMSDNMMLRSYRNGKSFFTDRKTPAKQAAAVKEELEVVTPSVNHPVRKLSGGNVQKVLVGREIANEPKVLLTAYAVRGLDINTSYAIYHLLTEQKQKGCAVVYVGEDLDVLLSLCDRILVLCGGSVSGILDGRTATKEQVGLMMIQKKKEQA